MKSYEPRKPLFSIHIPKCAGVSFTQVLQRWFEPNFFAHYYNEEKNQMPVRHQLKWQRFKIFHGAKKFACVHGHFNRKRGFGVFDYYPKADQFITVLRDPLQQRLSNFRYVTDWAERGQFYRQGHKIEALPYDHVDDYLANTNSFMLDFFPWQMTQANYKELITKHFVDILFVDQLQAGIDRLAARLGRQTVAIERHNASESKANPSKSAIQNYIDRHQFEYEVYNFAREAFGG